MMKRSRRIGSQFSFIVPLALIIHRQLFQIIKYRSHEPHIHVRDMFRNKRAKKPCDKINKKEYTRRERETEGTRRAKKERPAKGVSPEMFRRYVPADLRSLSSPDVGSPRTLVRQHICRPDLRTRSNRVLSTILDIPRALDRQLVSRKALPVYCGFGHASLVLTTATTSRPHLRRPTYIDHTSVPSSPSSS